MGAVLKKTPSLLPSKLACSVEAWKQSSEPEELKDEDRKPTHGGSSEQQQRKSFCFFTQLLTPIEKKYSKKHEAEQKVRATPVTLRPQVQVRTKSMKKPPPAIVKV